MTVCAAAPWAALTHISAGVILGCVARLVRRTGREPACQWT